MWAWARARARARAGARVRARVRPRVTCGLFSCLRRFMALAPRPMKGPNSCPRLGTGVKVRLNTVRIGVAQHGKVKVRLKCVSSRPARLARVPLSWVCSWSTLGLEPSVAYGHGDVTAAVRIQCLPDSLDACLGQALLVEVMG